MKPIKMIVVCDQNMVIGFKGLVPWRIRSEWDYFLRMTANSVICLGRKSYEERNHSLPGRNTIVLSKTRNDIKDALVVPSLPEAIKIASEKWPEKPFWICGKN